MYGCLLLAIKFTSCVRNIKVDSVYLYIRYSTWLLEQLWNICLDYVYVWLNSVSSSAHDKIFSPVYMYSLKHNLQIPLSPDII